MTVALVMQTERQVELHALAKALLEHETLTANEIRQVLDGTFARVPIAAQVAESDIDALLGQGSLVQGAEPSVQHANSQQ